MRPSELINLEKLRKMAEETLSLSDNFAMLAREAKGMEGPLAELSECLRRGMLEARKANKMVHDAWSKIEGVGGDDVSKIEDGAASLAESLKER